MNIISKKYKPYEYAKFIQYKNFKLCLKYKPYELVMGQPQWCET